MQTTTSLYLPLDDASGKSRSRHSDYVIMIIVVISNIRGPVVVRGWESHDHATLLRALHIALVVTSNPIPHSHEVEASLVKHIIHPRCDLQQSLREPVVEVLLLGGVIQSRVSEIVRSVG